MYKQLVMPGNTLFSQLKLGRIYQFIKRISGEDCNTLLQEGVANVIIRFKILYRHCYIPSFLMLLIM